MKLRANKVSAYTVLANIPSYFYLLVIPVVQNYLFDPRDFLEHIASYSVSLILAAGAAVISTADYYEKKFTSGENSIRAKMGLIVRTTYDIPYSRLHSVTFTTSPLLELFSAVKLTLGTPKHCGKSAVFYIKKETAEKLRGGFFGGVGEARTICRSKNRLIFLLSALLLNPMSGVFAAVPFLRAAGRAVGEELSGELLRSLDFSQQLVLIGIPPALAVLASLLIVAYALSVCVMFLRNADLSCRVYQGGISVVSGAPSVREIFVPYSKITKLYVRQTLLMRPFGAAALYICTGRPKGKIFAYVGEKNSVKELAEKIQFRN